MKLKPCPFCGRMVAVWEHFYLFGIIRFKNVLRINCVMCDFKTRWGYDKSFFEKATKAWNGRADEKV